MKWLSLVTVCIRKLKTEPAAVKHQVSAAPEGLRIDICGEQNMFEKA